MNAKRIISSRRLPVDNRAVPTVSINDDFVRVVSDCLDMELLYDRRRRGWHKEFSTQAAASSIY